MLDVADQMERRLPQLLRKVCFWLNNLTIYARPTSYTDCVCEGQKASSSEIVLNPGELEQALPIPTIAYGTY